MRITTDDLPEGWDAELQAEVGPDGALLSAARSSGGPTMDVVDGELIESGVSRTTTRRLIVEPEGFRFVTTVEVRHGGRGESEAEAEARRLVAALGRPEGLRCSGCGRTASCSDDLAPRMISFGQGLDPCVVCDACIDDAARMLASKG